MDNAKKHGRKKKSFFRRIAGAIGRVGTLNIVLVCVFGYMICLNWQMLQVFREYGSAPETAWCALIAALLGECGICGWIKTTKDRHQERTWQKEDERKQHTAGMDAGDERMVEDEL